MFSRLDLLKLSVIRTISKKKTIHIVNKRVLSYLIAGGIVNKILYGEAPPPPSLPFYIPFWTEKVPLSYNHPKTRKLDLSFVLTDTILYSNLNPVYIVKCCPGKKRAPLSRNDLLREFLEEKENISSLPKSFYEENFLRREEGREDTIKEIIIHLTHYLFSDWPKAYSEFSKSAPGTSSSCRLYNNHVKDTQGHG